MCCVLLQARPARVSDTKSEATVEDDAEAADRLDGTSTALDDALAAASIGSSPVSTPTSIIMSVPAPQAPALATSGPPDDAPPMAGAAVVKDADLQCGCLHAAMLGACLVPHHVSDCCAQTLTGGSHIRRLPGHVVLRLRRCPQTVAAQMPSRWQSATHEAARQYSNSESSLQTCWKTLHLGRTWDA